MKNDGQLVDEVLSGDTEAFGQLIRKYQDRLFNTMVYIVGSHEEAEEVVQDAFVAARIKLKTFEPDGAFYTWLYRIALSASLGRDPNPAAAKEIKPADGGGLSGEALERTERAGMAHAALAGLCRSHRAILVLREMEGLCYERIAEVLELPVGKVRARLFWARRQLRGKLTGTATERST